MLNPNIANKKAIFKYQQIEKMETSQAKCSLTISVGQDYHEGDKLLAALIAVNNNFNKCTVMVCDSLQRYTLKISSPYSLETLHHEANSLGKDWIERNSFLISRLDVPHNIIRWDHWLRHTNYQEARQYIDQLFLVDKGFQQAVNTTATLFLNRNLRKLSKAQEAEALILSQAYLKEECAVMLLWAKEKYQFEIYPRQRNPAMDYIYQFIISRSDPKLVRAVSIKFKNRTSIGKTFLRSTESHSAQELTYYDKAV